MTLKQNPLNLNPLQLRTLTIFQALARFPGAAHAGPQEGDMTITRFPQPHGDHFHLGDTAVIATKDATGLDNEAVWNALTRKGLAHADFPHTITLTKAGMDYDTGLRDQVIRRVGSHHPPA